MRNPICGLILAVSFCCPSLFAQQGALPSTNPAGKSAKAAPAIRKPIPPRLTPQQQHGIRLLRSAKAMADGLQPDMRTYLLWQVSHGYQKVAPAKALQALQQAFAASRAIEESAPADRSPEIRCIEQVCAIQRWLQREILSEMLDTEKGAWHPEAVENLLPRADPEVRTYTLDRLASAYVEKKNFARARDLLDQFKADDYPFSTASDLMAMLPSSPHDERIALFSQALTRFQDRSLDQVDPDERDFGIMVVRFWHDLPPSLALDAIDSLLNRAKDVDQAHPKGAVNLTLTSGDSFRFESTYEFRLFELLPVLQVLDKAKAESLLREHQQARSALDRYPNGFQSFDPKAYGEQGSHFGKDDPLPNMAQVFADDGENPAASTQLQAMVDEQAMLGAKFEKLSQDAAKHPEQAYNDALNLPLQFTVGPGCPRASGLRRFALAAVKSNPALARTAMTEARRLAQDIEPARQALVLADVPDFYLKLGDEPGARDAIKDQVKLAEKLYQLDSNSDDPNLAFKGAWPSANAWRNCVQAATRFSPAFAEEIIASIPDPEIEGFERVQYANFLLSAGESTISVMQWHEHGPRSGLSMRK